MKARMLEQHGGRRPKLLVMTGAGSSVDSGLPTFRKQHDDAPVMWGQESVTDVCSYITWKLAQTYQNGPMLVRIHNFYKRLQQIVRRAEPNAFHRFVRAVYDDDTYDITILTTNVDDLFEKVGIPSDKIIHLHGNIFFRRCLKCKHTFPDTNEELAVDVSDIPACPRIGCASSMVKTDVAFYDEFCMQYAKGKRAYKRLRAGDIILMVGSSGETFGDGMSLWEKCRKRNVRTVHVNPNAQPHLLYRADNAYLCGIQNALPTLETIFRQPFSSFQDQSIP